MKLDAGQMLEAEELQGMVVSSPNPKWMSVLALRRRSLV
jgi:hypothetical protein